MDTVDKGTRSRIMASIRGKDTDPELAVARTLAAMGVFAVRHPALPGKPDFYVPSARLVIFVHGCFWHGCRRHYREPKSNPGFWRRKLEGNMARDRRAARGLRRIGVSVGVVWEHDAKGRRK